METSNGQFPILNMICVVHGKTVCVARGDHELLLALIKRSCDKGDTDLQGAIKETTTVNIQHMKHNVNVACRQVPDGQHKGELQSL